MRDPEKILREVWNYTEFRGSQKAVIDSILGGRDVLALLPTGGGKSLCYQIPAMAQEGICIVVSPLIALMQDQVAALQKRGIKAISLSGGIPYEEVDHLLDNCRFGNYKFLYLSPERLQQELVRERIARMNVNLLAVDEAHCISQWGNDFRPAYLHCSALRELHPSVPMLALTATATLQVSAEIIQNLKLNNCLTVKDSFSRDNIAFGLLHEEDKRYRILQLCAETEESGIVYVRSRRLSEELADFLNSRGCAAAYYHGGLGKNEKKEKLQLWLEDRVRIMVATNAFGMGVDKANVALVVHYQLADSLESYFQEAGRAGRNGAPARAVLLTDKTDESRLKNQFLNVLPDAAYLKRLYRHLNNYLQIPYGTGENEVFYLHFHAFCETYNLNGTLAYNGLRLLDQYSVIALSQVFKRFTEIQFLASKEQLMNYLGSHPVEAPLIQVVLRTYGGIFDYMTRVNTLGIAKKTGVSEESILNLLEDLKRDGIIKYDGKVGDLELIFLVPREDERTIHAFAKELKAQQEVKVQNVEAMLTYVRNDTVCRNIQLLTYFGEQRSGPCGICDVCRRREKPIAGLERRLRTEVLEMLGKGGYSSRELIRQLQEEEQSVLRVLQDLLESGTISINTKNEYYIN